jgi:hypothetical protein
MPLRDMPAGRQKEARTMVKLATYALMLAGMSAFWADVALAQPVPPWAWVWWPAMHPVSSVLVGAAGLAALVLMVRRHRQSRERRAGLDALDRRFAHGEIDKAEYEEKRRLIMGA